MTLPFGRGLAAIKDILSDKPPVLSRAVESHRQFGPLSQQLAELILTCLQTNPNSTSNRSGVGSEL